MKSKKWSQYTRVKYPVSSSLHPFNFFVPIVERVQEGVVSIVTEDTPHNKDVDSLIRSLISEEENPLPTERSFGSGFLFHPKGYILTSEHVIGKSKTIYVKLYNGRVFEAKRILADRVRDYAVIKIDADCKLFPLPLGNSAHTKVGEWVISVGSPPVAIETKIKTKITRSLFSDRVARLLLTAFNFAGIESADKGQNSNWRQLLSLCHLLFSSPCATICEKKNRCNRGDANMSHDFSGEHMCPKYECAINVLGKRWTGLIIHVLLRGTVRFKDIRELVPHMSDKMLSERLKELEELGILERKVYPEIPVRIEYELTEKGKDLRPVIESIHEWGQKWM